MENKKTILIVEDEATIIDVLKEKLTDEGFFVVEAGNGEDGLAKAVKYHPDLILLDIVMPGMNGVKMLEKLKEDEWGRDAKVIFLTNLSDEEKIAETYNLNPSDYLIKAEWSIGEVVKKVKDKLRV